MFSFNLEIFYLKLIKKFWKIFLLNTLTFHDVCDHDFSQITFLYYLCIDMIVLEKDSGVFFPFTSPQLGTLNFPSKNPSLSCYLTPSWGRENEWIHTFLKVISTKVNVTE